MSPLSSPSVSNQSRYLKWLHALQGILFPAIAVLSIVNIALKKGRLSRNDTWIIAVTAKSINFLLYIVLSDHWRPAQRFHSLKAYMILDIIEAIFWPAAIVLTAMRIGQCTGVSCGLGYGMIGLAAVNAVVALFVVYISILQWLYKRRTGRHPNPNHFTNAETTQVVRLGDSNDKA